MSALANAISKLFQHAVWNQEVSVFRPAIRLFSKAHFIFTQGFAVRSIRVLLMGCAIADMAVHDDDRGPVFGGQEFAERFRKRAEIIRIAYVDHVPAVPSEAHRNIFAEGPVRGTIQRDLVRVVDPAQIRQLQMASQ